MDVRRSPRLAGIILAALALPLEATHPGPGPHFLHCRSEANVVRLEWDEMGFTEQSSVEARLERDGNVIAGLSSSNLGYIDRGVPAGEHTYRLVVAEGERTIDSKECLVSVGAGVPPPEDIQCSIQAWPLVDLAWRNPVEYDSVVVRRDADDVAVLEGGATRFTDQPGLGLHTYEVLGILRGELGAPAMCEADLGGTPFHRLHLVNLQPAGAGPAGPLPASDQLLVMLDNSYPVTAWSFGLCSDPALILPVAIELGTPVTTLNFGAGPRFLAIDLHAGGFTMRAVIDDADPTAVLGAGIDHRLLTLLYAGGPQAIPGEVYPLEFCDTLGEPPVPIALEVNGQKVLPVTDPGLVMVSARFLRGDSNVDGNINITDGVFTLDWLFRGGSRPSCLDAADIDSNHAVNIADAVYTINFLFLGGPEPPGPFPRCGAATVAVGCDRTECP